MYQHLNNFNKIVLLFFDFFLPLPPLKGQPVVIMPTLLASQQGIDMSLQVGEMPDSNPGLQVLQPGALPKQSGALPKQPNQNFKISLEWST